jgi:hypothetical protein
MQLKRNGLPQYVTVFVDRHGKRRYRFRRIGGLSCYLPEPTDVAFKAAYRQAMRGVGVALDELRAKADTIGVCYFVGGDLGLIKIGKAKDPVSRLAQISTHSPIPVRIFALAPGGETAERAYHRQFAEFRRHGEWFDRGDSLMAEIARLNPRWQLPVSAAELLLEVRRFMLADASNRAVAL